MALIVPRTDFWELVYKPYVILELDMGTLTDYHNCIQQYLIDDEVHLSKFHLTAMVTNK